MYPVSYPQENRSFMHGYHYESCQANGTPQDSGGLNVTYDDYSPENASFAPSLQEPTLSPPTFIERATTPITDLSLNTRSAPLSSEHHVMTSYSAPSTWIGVSGGSSAAQNWTHLTIAPTIAPSTASVTSISHKPRVECIFCDKTFPNRTRATAHMYKHMNVKPFVCSGTCGIATWYVYLLVNALKKLSDSGTALAQCLMHPRLF
jgi:hypothetical protein